MRWLRHSRIVAAGSAACILAAVIATPVTAQAAPTRTATPPATTAAGTDVVRNPDAVLPAGWRASTDRAVTSSGDEDGFHILVADQNAAYHWRTAATLSEPGFDTTTWIGQQCTTGSGDFAAVVYAPRELTNHGAAFGVAAFAAIVDLRDGSVHKLPVHASLAYYDPGCGTGDEVVFSGYQGQDTGTGTSTRIWNVDAATATVTRSVTVAGQVTSAVPFGSAIAAASGNQLVTVDAAGTTHRLAEASGTPFRLHPDAHGGLAYETPAGPSTVQVHRYAAGSDHVQGSAPSDRIQLAAAGGRVFVLGPDAAAISQPAWTSLGGTPDADPSTLGSLLVSATPARTAPPSGQDTADGSHPVPGIDVTGVLTASHKTLPFTVVARAPHPDQGAAASPVLQASASKTASRTASKAASGTVQPATTDPSTVTYDPDRACSIPRNDPSTQTYQATAAQVEWAADLAVQGQLTASRGVNWEGSGMPVSWTPQGMFPLLPLSGGGSVPAQVLLGVLAQESNTLQASPHAVDALTGNFNQGGFYGYAFTDGSGSTQPADSSWTSADCGYGVGQVTTGMALSTPAGTLIANANPAYTTAEQQRAIATDYASNIAASLNMLIGKWNQLKAAGIIANDADPRYVENWYLAEWAYNSGVQPDAKHGNTGGCTPGPTCTDGAGYWGLGWFNNPANPAYPYDRGVFTNSAADTKVPNHWTYPELVTGWAYSPVPRYNYATQTWGPAFLRAGNPNGAVPVYPPRMTFCTVADDHCTPNAATDVTGHANTAGLCQATNSDCWWHAAVTWTDCAVSCGTGNYAYTSSSAKPLATDIYPPDCSTSALPATAVIVDDVTTPSAIGSCTKTWTDKGAFTTKFAYDPVPGCVSPCVNYPGKIDFHQISVGFGGHIWFTHTSGTAEVTGTWTPPSTVTGWTRIKVHIPDNGATTEEADYQINLGNGQQRHRMISQHWNQNTWVDLGSFNLAAGASVSLSNSSPALAGITEDGGDIAFDAVAFIPTVPSTIRYVALGDSYSSGESMSPYEADSAQNGDGCHRSNQAYPYQLTLPGLGKTIAAAAAANQGADFAFGACSGAETIAMTAQSVDASNTMNTDWAQYPAFQWGEPFQVDDGGFLDQDTTLVTLSIGGNDARFSDVIQGCIATLTDCTSSGYYLTRQNGKVDPEPLTTYEPKVISALQAHLVDVYAAVHAQAPNARILVLDYPRLFEPGGSTIACLTLNQNDQVWLNSMADQLDTTISNAVAQTKTSYPGLNISVVDVRSAFVNNELCSSSPWITGLVPSYVASSFHPEAPGHAAEAGLANTALAH